MILQSGFEDSPGNVAIIGDDVNSDLGDGAEELDLHRFLGKTRLKTSDSRLD
jgi:hypothetical protein